MFSNECEDIFVLFEANWFILESYAYFGAFWIGFVIKSQICMNRAILNLKKN